ncbi:MAG: hypothetical protein WAK12_11175 [Acidimicrobiales bacterium]
MTPDTDLEELLRSLDPLSEDVHRENARHQDSVWARVLAQVSPSKRRTRRRLIALGSIATVGAATALVVGLLPSGSPLNATAATLHRAALDDASAMALPTLGAGQYYYQETQITLTCSFAGMTSSGWGPWVTYDANATMQSWTAPNLPGQISITPTAIGQGGSHFATPSDEANWVAEGKPFIPCSFQGPPTLPNSTITGASPSLSPIPAEPESIESFNGFGFMLPAQNTPAPTPGSLGSGSPVSANSLLALPNNASEIQTMLANGEINPDGSVSTTPQVCPMDAAAGAAPGCNTNQQLTLIEQLLRWPEASAKLGSVLYQVLEQMPGATAAANTTDSFGNTGTTLTVPDGGSANRGEEFQVVLDPATGSLLSSTLLGNTNPNGTTNATYSPGAALSYGPVDVVSGVGTLPSSTN